MSDNTLKADNAARVTLSVDLLVLASELSCKAETMLCAVSSAGLLLEPDRSQALSDAVNAVRSQLHLLETQIHLIPQAGQAR